MELKGYIAKTHQGPYLQINEDDVVVDVENKLFMVLDGFGGSGIGDVAVKKVGDSIKKFYTHFGTDPDSTLPIYFSHKYLIEGNAVINAIRIAHNEMLQANSERPMQERGGASVVCAALSENILELVSTGNMMAVLCRRGQLFRLVLPDNHETLAADNFERHFLTLPTSGIGLFDDIHLKSSEVRIHEDDIVVLVSDGLYGRILDEEIRYVLSKSDSDLYQKADELIQMANSRGNLDNQSILILEF